MSSYYFDCETSREGRDHVDPKLDRLVSISFQEINSRTGNPIGELQILKSWENSEKSILSEFLNKTRWLETPPKSWEFIPIGFNLSFDLWVIYYRTRKNLEHELSLDFLFHQLPKIDIKPIFVLVNGGKFKGASLDKFSDKLYDGAYAYESIQEEKWDDLLQYIKDETESFLKIYQQLLKKFPTILKRISKNLKLKN